MIVKKNFDGSYRDKKIWLALRGILKNEHNEAKTIWAEADVILSGRIQHSETPGDKVINAQFVWIRI